MAKILIIDDSRFARNLIKEMLGPEHEYIEAYDGLMGTELFLREKPDLVILDLTMPGIHGLRVLQDLHRMAPRCPILVGTADIQDLTKEEALQRGAFAVVHKPYEAEALRAVVAQALSTREQGHADA